MKNHSILLKILISGLFLTLISCGKDKDFDDYKKERQLKDMAKYEIIKGEYTGLLISKRDNSVLGALKVSLNPTTIVRDTTDGSNSNAQPIITSNIQFKGVTSMNVTSESSYYNETNGYLKIEIPISGAISGSSDRGGSSGGGIGGTGGTGSDRGTGTQTGTVRLTLEATVSDGRMSGNLWAIGFDDYGGSLSLTKDGQSLDTLVQENAPTKDLLFTHSFFLGKSKFKTGEIKNTSLILLKPRIDSNQDFINLFVPVKQVLLTLNYGNDARISFLNGNWDQRTGIITGTTTLTRNNDSVELSIVCHITNDRKAMGCDATTSASSSAVAQLDLVAADSSKDIPNDNTGGEPISKDYAGEKEDMSDHTKAPVWLHVVYPARTRLTELLDLFMPRTEVLVDVSFKDQYGNSHLFSQSKYDINKNTVDQIHQFQRGTDMISASINCRRFNIFATKYNFECNCNIDAKDMIFRFKSR